MSYVLTNVLSCSCSLFFLHCRSFSPCWPLFLIFSQPISMFFEICLLFLFNALALYMLSTSLKILKFSRTCLWARSIQPNFPEISVQNSMDRFGPAGKVSKKRVHLLRWSSFSGRTGWNFGWMDHALGCWFFSLLSPDGLSLSKKSGWTLGFPPKNPCCICHTCWLSYFTLICLWCGRVCVRSRDYLCTVNQNSYPWCTKPKMFVVNQDVKNAKIDLCHAAAILSQDI